MDPARDGRSECRGRILYEDRDVVSDTRYAYRIEASGPDGRQVSNEAWVEVPSRIAFALDGASPNPVSGDLIVAFTLPSAAPASLDVFGADGRRVLHRRLDLEPGRHWVRTARSGEIAPGIYLIRLTQGRRRGPARVGRALESERRNHALVGEYDENRRRSWSSTTLGVHPGLESLDHDR